MFRPTPPAPSTAVPGLLVRDTACPVLRALTSTFAPPITTTYGSLPPMAHIGRSSASGGARHPRAADDPVGHGAIPGGVPDASEPDIDSRSVTRARTFTQRMPSSGSRCRVWPG